MGNDVVDLGDPAIATSHLRERFVARVLGPAERAVLARAVDPKAWLWACFAVKEAAYKLRCKQRPGVILAHRAFEVAGDLRSVRHGGARLKARVHFGDGHVHAVVWTEGEEPSSYVGGLGEGEDPGRAARARLRSALGGDPDLELVREPRPGSWDGFGPPRVVLAGQPLAIDVSLSHDGRFVAHALAPGA